MIAPGCEGLAGWSHGCSGPSLVRSSLCRVRRSDEAVDGGFDLEPGPVSGLADVAEFAAGADGFDPAEGFLDAFADPLRRDVADVAGGAPIDRGAPVRRVLRDMGVDGEEVAGDGCLGAQELVSGHRRAHGCGVDAVVFEDLSNGRRGDGVAESDEFAVDAPVPSGRVLLRESHYQLV